MSLWDCVVQHGAQLWFHDSNDSLILCLAVDDKYNISNIYENNESIKLKLGMSNVLYERPKMMLTGILLSQQSWFEFLSASKQTLPFTSVDEKYKIFQMPVNIFNIFSRISWLNSHTKTLCLRAFWGLRNMISRILMNCYTKFGLPVYKQGRIFVF